MYISQDVCRKTRSDLHYQVWGASQRQEWDPLIESLYWNCKLWVMTWSRCREKHVYKSLLQNIKVQSWKIQWYMCYNHAFISVPLSSYLPKKKKKKMPRKVLVVWPLHRKKEIRCHILSVFWVIWLDQMLKINLLWLASNLVKVFEGFDD